MPVGWVCSGSVNFQPTPQRLESDRPHPIDTVLAVAQANKQTCPLEPLHVLYDRRTRDGQLSCQYGSRCRMTRQALEDHNADGLAKEREELECLAEFASMCM